VRTPPAKRGQTLTSGPVSTGIDLALHLVARLDSVDVARQVPEYLGYTPDLVV
jgi:transcriptional regulator GlxA family with amidase domain